MVILKTYKKHKIVRNKDGIIKVYSPDGSKFTVALDEDVPIGQKTIIESANNVKSAMDYIDWKTR